MIRQQFFRDPFFTPLVWSLVLAVLVAFIVVMIGRSDLADFGHQAHQFSVVLLAGICVSFMLRPEAISRRFSEVWLTLPISHRSLSRVRFAVLLGACALPGILVWIVLLLFWPGELPREIHSGCIGFLGAVVLTVAVMDLCSHGKNVLRTMDVVPGFLLLLVALASTSYLQSVGYSRSVLGVAVVLAGYAWSSTPDWISAGVHPAERNRLPVESDNSMAGRSRGASSLKAPSLSLIYTVKSKAWWVLNFSAGFIVGLMTHYGGSMIAFVPIGVMHLFNLNRANLDSLSLIGHLPIRRWRSAPIVVLSPLIAGLVGIALVNATGIGNQTGYPFSVQLNSQRFEVDGEQEFYTELQVPKVLWELHVGFDQPVIELETTEGATQSVALTGYRPVPFLPLAAYNPYEVGPDSSIEFVAAQVVRAVDTGYGLALTAEFVQERFLEIGRDGRVGRKRYRSGENSTDLRGHLEELELLAQPGSTWSAPLTFLILWSLIGLVNFRLRQFPQDPKRTLRNLMIFSGALAIVLLVGFLKLENGAEFSSALWHSMGAILPQNNLFAAACYAVLCAGPALYFMRVYTKMDVPTHSGMKVVPKSR